MGVYVVWDRLHDLATYSSIEHVLPAHFGSRLGSVVGAH